MIQKRAKNLKQESIIALFLSKIVVKIKNISRQKLQKKERNQLIYQYVCGISLKHPIERN